MHYYKNNEMFPTCKKEHSLKKENYLSEFVTTNQKEFARDNLGITDIINSLDKKIDAKVIEFEGIAWDLVPTDGNTEKVLSSDAIYKALSLYVTSKEIESIEGGLQKLVKDSSDSLDLELNKAVESLLDKIQCLKQEFAKYTTQINSIIKAFRSGGAFNVSQYLQQAQSLDYTVKLTLQNAVNNAPDVAKNAGQIITFLDTENVWQQYQYQSDTIDDWDNLLKWKNLNDSSSTPIEEGAHIYNISEYLPGGTKYGQLIGAGVYTIYGDITPVSQYRTIFGWDPDLGEVNNPAKKDTSLVIKEIDTDGVAAYEYYVFVGNDGDGYGYQATFLSTEDIPEWITKAFGSTDNSILVNINKLKEEIDRTKISKGGLKTIQGKSIEGTGNIEIDTYINQFASSNNPINWNWGGDGNIASVDIDNVKGVKASYSEEYTTGNVYSTLDVTLKAKQHYLFSFYLSGEGECDLSLSDLWDNVYVREFSNPIIIDGDEYIEHTDWKSHLNFTSVGYHYISFYANTSATAQIDFEFNTNNNIIFYKPLFVACNPKANINWFTNNEDIFTTNEQFGIAFKGVTYNSSTKNIEFICVDNTKKYLDATDFVKDGMVSNVAIEDDNLVITFNTDSGKEAIIIPLIDIFNPANYYTKTYIDSKLVPATTTALGLVKLYNTNGTNKSGLLIQEDGSLLINTSSKDGLYRDALGQLKANIKGAATDEEINEGTSTEKAITPSNLSKVKESFGLSIVATSGSYNDLDNKPTIPTNTSELNNDSKFVSEDDISPITKQFIGEITDNVSDYNKYFGGGPITLLGEWSDPSSSNEVCRTTSRQFGIAFSNNFKHLFIKFNSPSTYGMTGAKVTIKDGDKVLDIQSLNDGGYGNEIALTITNNGNTKDCHINISSISFTYKNDVVITSDVLNFEMTDAILYTSLLKGMSHVITYDGIIKLHSVAFSGSYNDLTNTPTIPTRTYIVEHTTEETTIASLTPNVLHKWGTMASLTISALATPSDNTIVNEYMIEFTSGSTPTVLSLPNTIVWAETPNIEANATYQISIINNLGIIVKFS